jgi:hypothetical protein
MNFLIRNIGRRVARQAAQKHIGEGATLDPKRGWAMLRDRNVPVGAKALSLVLGTALTAALVSLEVPLETLLGLFFPVAGVAADVLMDGAEMILCPLLFATLILPFVAPKPVAQTRAIAPRR